MGDLYRRAWSLAVDDLQFTQHRVTAKIEKTVKPDPNTADIAVYNLTDEQRSKISEKKTPLVRLAVGYAPKGTPDLTQIWNGQCIHVEHERKDADVITHLTTGDGIEAYRRARINLSFGPRTKIDVVLRALVREFGLKPGNLDAVARALSSSLKAQIYLSGTALSGACATEMSALCRSAGLEWSIQDGAVQILDLNKALAGFSILLSPTTGLVGSPSVSNKGIVSGTCKIIKDFIPGRQLELDARWVKGRSRVEKVTYVVDSRGDDWDCQFEARGAATQAAAKISAAKKVGK
jgi:hypothetical protein